MSYFKVICLKTDSNNVEEIDSDLYSDAYSKWKSAGAICNHRIIMEVYESSDVNEEGERFKIYKRENLDLDDETIF